MDANTLMALMKAKKQSLKQKVKTLKPDPGANRYVILQGWRPTDTVTFFHDFGQHYVKNMAGEIQAVYPCLDKTFGSPCPICAGLNKAIRATTDDETIKVLKEAASAQSYLLNVLALDSDQPDTPQILEIKKSAFGQIVDIIEEWGVTVLDSATPQIITLNRDGKGLNTKYTVQISPKKHAIPKGALGKLNDLDDYVRQENEEQQRRALSAISSVAGLLPAPAAASSKDMPRTAASSIDAGDDALREMEVRATAASKPSKADIALDDELDDLLGEMTGTGA